MSVCEDESGVCVGESSGGGGIDYTIDIKGEGDILIDRWVTDTNTYKVRDFKELSMHFRFC